MNHLTSHQIQEYVGGVAPDAIELHVRLCSECQSNVSAFRALERAIRSIPLEKASPRFTERIMRSLSIKQSTSFSWMLFKNLAPILALMIVAGIVFAVLRATGVWQATELQQTATLTQTVYDQFGGSLNGGVQTFNDWMAKYFSFAFARNTYGLTAFVLIFLGAIALLDKYILMPMMKKRM